MKSEPPIADLSPQLDIQRYGPFGNGKAVSAAEAESLSGLALPPPPETDVTGSLTGIWINDHGDEVAYVWESDLRLYVSRLMLETEDVEAVWKAKADDSSLPFETVALSFGVGLGVEGGGSNPSSLSFQKDGYYLQMVGPVQSLDQLVQLAESVALHL